MSLDLGAEVKKAEFLDWVKNNKSQIIEDLILEEEEILIKMWELEKEVNCCNEGVD